MRTLPPERLTATAATRRTLTVAILLGLGSVSLGRTTLAQSVTAGPGELAPDIRRIVERGELVVAMPSFDEAPYFFTRDGRFQGTEVDLAEGIARVLKVRLRVVRSAASYDGIVDVVARGEADLAVCNLGQNTERAMRVRFSDPYMDSHLAMALNRTRLAALSRGTAVATVVRSFSGRIGVEDGSIHVGHARQYFPAAEIVTFIRWDDAWRAVKDGEVDAILSDEYDIRSVFRLDPRNTLVLKQLVFTDTNVPAHIALRHDSLHLLSLVNLYLAQRRDKPTVDDLLKRLRPP